MVEGLKPHLVEGLHRGSPQTEGFPFFSLVSPRFGGLSRLSRLRGAHVTPKPWKSASSESDTKVCAAPGWLDHVLNNWEEILEEPHTAHFMFICRRPGRGFSISPRKLRRPRVFPHISSEFWPMEEGDLPKWRRW